MAERRLIVEIIGDSRSLERALGRSSKATDKFGRDVSQAGRGVVAVSGVFSGLGRQVAFASGAFLGGAGFTKVLKDSISEAEDAQKAQRSLAAQFRAVGQSLAPYQRQIDATSTRLSRLAGIQDEEFTQAFTAAFRGTRDVAAALKVESVAADVARGRNIAVSTSAIALTKAYLGQTTALKRLGIQIPANVKGMDALNLVGRRFAGQAAANTTTSERLNTALSETEETIGKGLLPNVEKLQKRIADWLNNSENQRKLQHDVNEGLRITGNILKGLDDLWRAAAKGVDVYNRAVSKVPGHNKSLLDIFNGLPPFLRHGLLDLGRHPSPGHVLPGQSPIGENALGSRPPATSAVVGQAQAGPLGLTERERKLQLALTKAERTRAQGDDRAILVELGALVRQEIASKKKVFKDKLALNQKLTQIDQQIRAIDDAAAQKRQDQIEAAAAKAKKARDKERAARKKAHDAAVKAAQKQRAEALQESREVHAQAEKLRDLIQTERDRIGDLFAGPIFNPSEAQQKRALGAPVVGANAKQLVADLKGQINQFKSLERDLATLARRGAPPQLLAELRQQGLAVAPQVHALATAGGQTFGQFKQLFIQRERLAVSAAKQERPINVNLTVNVNRDTGEVKVVRTTPHGQARGRNPGVLVNPVNPGRP